MSISYDVPVVCQFPNQDGFREPEGTVIVNRYPVVGDVLILSDKKEWIVVAVEGDPNYCWPEVICELKGN